MLSQYLIIPIGLLALMLYAFSYLLVWLGIWKITSHRKCWNTMLLCTFLVTAVLGLLLVVQINYKLEWNSIESILKWHVNAGIAMSFIAVFHVIWHWKYYLNLFKHGSVNNPVKKTHAVRPEINNGASLHLVILSGFMATIIQVLYIREITTVFQGNELIMAWTLGIWMFLVGIGAWLGRKSKELQVDVTKVSGIIFFISLLPLILIPMLSVLKTGLFPPGIMVNPLSFALIISVLLFPVCILSGLTYAWLIRLFRNEDDDFIKVYGFEALGSMAGGICVSFIMVKWCSIMESLLIMAILTNGALFMLQRRRLSLITGIICSLLLIVFLIYPVNEKIRSFLFVNQNVIETVETHYGNLTILENAGQYSFYENGNLIFTSENTIISEEFVHFVMLQHNRPSQILLVSGGISGMIKELLKYPSVENIDYVELNPGLFKLAEKYALLPEDERINIIYGDARRYLNRNRAKFDIAIMALPDPSSLQINRLYSDDYVQLLKKHLNPGAVIIFGISPSGNYMSSSKLRLEAAIYNTLRKNFQNVSLIPGERDYFIASDADISIAISQLYNRHTIENTYVNEHYIDDVLIEQRSNAIINSISKESVINTDNKPQPVYFNTVHFLSQFNLKLWLVLLVPVMILIIPFFRSTSVSKSVYLAGFVAASVEILLIFIFQVVFGYVYSAIGIIIAVFMVGLWLGAYYGRGKIVIVKNLIFSMVLLVIYSLLLILSWLLANRINSDIALILLFILLTLIPSALTGYIYVAATKLSSMQVSEAAPVNYSVDMLGSALGVLVFSVVVIPLAGILAGCLILMVVSLLGVILNLKRSVF